MIRLLLFLSAMTMFSASAHEVRNGGDSLAISIYRRGDELIARWKALTPSCLAATRADLAKVATQWEWATVDTTPEVLILDGVFKEALNSPARAHVVFHRPSYQISEEKDVLIVHEQLGLAGYNDPKYKQSREIVALLYDPACRSPQAGLPTPQPQAHVPAGLSEPAVNFMPDSVAWDHQDTVFLLSAASKVIFRYSLKKWCLKCPKAKSAARSSNTPTRPSGFSLRPTR